MFGGLAFMINGHMCCGVVKTDLMLRLTEEAVTKALHETHTRPMDFSGKPMRTMVYVDARGTDSEAALHSWVENAYAHAFTLPPKPVKPKSRE